MFFPMITRIFRGKLVIVGNPAVGKTAISQMYIKDGREFSKNYSMTFAAEVNTLLIPIPGTSDAVELLIYDSPGTDLYTELLEKFWHEPDLLMVVFDLTKLSSLESVLEWNSLVKKCKWKNGSPVVSVLFGNKADLDKRRQVSDQQAVQVADSCDMKYFSGSVKINQGLEDPMQFLADSYYKHCLRNNITM